MRKNRTRANADSADFRKLVKKSIQVFLIKPVFIRILFLLLICTTSFAQDLPNEIRGYKVHKAEISVQNQTGESKPNSNDAITKLGDPALIDVSVTGITFEIPGEVSNLKQSGRVDFIAFKDFRVNGLQVEIEEYKESFEFKKNQTIKFPKPIRISLSLGQAMRGALKEWRESKDVWQVTGRVFVFGRFNKFGFKFKRVIPIDVNLQIKNPLKDKQSAPLSSN